MVTKLKKIKNERGSTLIEVILSALVLSTALFSSYYFSETATIFALKTDREYVGIQLAKEKLEMLFADKTALGYGYVVDNNYPQENISTPQQTFVRKIKVFEVATNDLTTPQPGSGLKRVNIDILWGPHLDNKVKMTGVITK